MKRQGEDFGRALTSAKRRCYRIHLDGSGEWFEVSGESIDECRNKAYEECNKRGWSSQQVWSELMVQQGG